MSRQGAARVLTKRLAAALVTLIPFLSAGCRTVPVDPPWEYRIGLEVLEFRRHLGVPFDDARSEWSWRMRLTWDGEFPLAANLRLFDLYLQPGHPSGSLLCFHLPQSPAEVAVHIVPLGATMPEAEQIVLVVSYGDEVKATPMANPFRGATGGSPTPGWTSFDDPGATHDPHAELQLISVRCEDPLRLLMLYIDLHQG